MKKTIVIYHRADFDGIFCREIAKKFMPDAQLIGWDYGDQTPPIPADVGMLVMLDISVDALMNHEKLVWIDHHKSAMEKYHHGIPGYRIDGVAACRLAWQWFSLASTALQGDFDFTKAMAYFGVARVTEGVEPHNNNVKLPLKSDFVDRIVSEPWAVRLAGEYDIWDKRDPDAELFQHGLRSQDLDSLWDILLSGPTAPVGDKQGLAEITVAALLDNGLAIQYAQTKQNESIIKAAGFTIEFEGLKFLACNHARYNSFLFTAGLTPEHDGCFGFAWRDGHWNVSLYHAPGKEHHDLSQIAVKYGGGGHRGACGFRVKELPFLK